jgi:CRISPR/Cas system CSM-associated protein Csm3 (group 7 of RAMP superfamily)
MTTSMLCLTFNILSDWHIGSGEEAGAYSDSLVIKSHDLLPFLPGRSIRGLLRESMQLAVDNNWCSAQDLLMLFGNEGQNLESQGLLRISSANLSSEEQQYLLTNPGAIAKLYRILQFTAIDHQTGVAKDSSLRSMEVAIPMTLTADISLNINHPDYTKDNASHLLNLLANVCPLIAHLGAKRSRGLGQVEVSAQLKGDL